ncbi:MAG: ABC transporter permease subunit [Nitrospirota bacterium]
MQTQTIPDKINFWRNVIVLRIVMQALFVIAIALVAGLLYTNMLRGLEGLGLTFNFEFLKQEAGFGIAEGIDYAPSDTYFRAFQVGALNSLKVSVLGIIFATLLGLLFGVSRLSGNWLVRKIAAFYVECFRNIPLLLQILFWYTVVILQLPPVRESITLFHNIFISQRGIYIPWLKPMPGFAQWAGYIAAGVILPVLIYILKGRKSGTKDFARFAVTWGLPVFTCLAVSGWYMSPQTPLVLEVPVLQRFNFTGGVRLSPEFSALLIGLSVYTSAFIAEVVRGGIQSVKEGQVEAAKAVGLNESQTLRLVVLPQALRVIIPPLSNQHLNLAKNSSLAIAVGFPDLFNVGSTMMNQTGQSIPVFTLIMASYLIMSIIASLFLNWYNRRVRIIEQ